jgi:hypothetical protein
VAASLSFGAGQAVASGADVKICDNCCTTDEYCMGRCHGAGYLAGYCYQADCYCTS